MIAILVGLVLILLWSLTSIPFWIAAVGLAIWCELRQWRPLLRIPIVAVAAFTVAANFPGIAAALVQFEHTVLTATGQGVHTLVSAL